MIRINTIKCGLVAGPRQATHFVAERECHDGDQQTEEELELPQAVLVEEQERECVHDSDQRTDPQWNSGRGKR